MALGRAVKFMMNTCLQHEAVVVFEGLSCQVCHLLDRIGELEATVAVLESDLRLRTRERDATKQLCVSGGSDCFPG